MVTLGDFIINRNVYGDEGVLAGAILVALLAIAVEFGLAGLQRLLTPQGPEVGAGALSRIGLSPSDVLQLEARNSHERRFPW